jgi:hypothetical protein
VILQKQRFRIAEAVPQVCRYQGLEIGAIPDLTMVVVGVRGELGDLIAHAAPDAVGGRLLFPWIHRASIDLRNRLVQNLIEVSGLAAHDSSPT